MKNYIHLDRLLGLETSEHQLNLFVNVPKNELPQDKLESSELPKLLNKFFENGNLASTGWASLNPDTALALSRELQNTTQEAVKLFKNSFEGSASTSKKFKLKNNGMCVLQVIPFAKGP